MTAPDTTTDTTERGRRTLNLRIRCAPHVRASFISAAHKAGLTWADFLAALLAAHDEAS